MLHAEQAVLQDGHKNGSCCCCCCCCCCCFPQAGLLCAPWPEELLSHPDGCEVWARRVRPRPSSLHPTPHGTLLRQGAALGAGLGGSSRAPRSEDGDRCG